VDRASADVLAFVARRLDFEPVVLLVAMRDDFHGSFDAGLPELSPQRLDQAAAAALLDARAPGLQPAVRELVLGEAAGNPLALVELPIVMAQVGEGAVSTSLLPLTTRLEQAFAARVSGLPTASGAVTDLMNFPTRGTRSRSTAAGGRSPSHRCPG